VVALCALELTAVVSAIHMLADGRLLRDTERGAQTRTRWRMTYLRTDLIASRAKSGARVLPWANRHPACRSACVGGGNDGLFLPPLKR